MSEMVGKLTFRYWSKASKGNIISGVQSEHCGTGPAAASGEEKRGGEIAVECPVAIHDTELCSVVR